MFRQKHQGIRNVIILTGAVAFGIYLLTKGLNGFKTVPGPLTRTALTEAFTVGNRQFGE